MSNRSPKEVRLVIPDSGVLISLAHGNLLWLLTKVADKLHISITDVVEYEVTQNLNMPDAQQLNAFLTKNKHLINVEETAFGELLKAKKSDPNIPLPKNAGELSIYGLINDVRSDHPSIPTVVLFEDNWFLKNQTRPNMVHLVSLSTFLRISSNTIENFSYEEAVRSITKTRPHVNLVEHDSIGVNDFEDTETSLDSLSEALRGPR